MANESIKGQKISPAEIFNPKAKTSLLEDAIGVIKDAVENGHLFNSEHMDVFIDAMLHVLPEGERPWFREVAEMNGVPKWQALWAQWRRVQEYGVAPALLLDPNWESIDKPRQVVTVCEWCHEDFKPDHEGQRFCTNRCGGQAELAAKQVKTEVADVAPIPV